MMQQKQQQKFKKKESSNHIDKSNTIFKVEFFFSF